LLLAALPGFLCAAPLKTVAEFQAQTAPFHSAVTPPPFERTAAEVTAHAAAAIAEADAAIDVIVHQDVSKATFESTFVALDYATSLKGVGGRLNLISETSTSADVRAAAKKALVDIGQWGIGIDYRADLYGVLKTFAATKPTGLSVEDQRLMEFSLLDYHRAGYDLPPEVRDRVEAERKQLTTLQTQISTNINEARASLVFTKAELAGVPDSFLAQPGIKTGNDAYTVQVNVTPQRQMVEVNCSVAETRRKVVDVEYHMAQDKNAALFDQLVALRAQVARDLGYGSWDDYRIEPKMAKNGATATAFIGDLIKGIQPKFDGELAEMAAVKAKDTGDPAAKIDIYDWRYYQDQVVKQKYTIDSEALRVYFPFEHVLRGMFDIYQSIFGLKFEQLEPPYVWADGVTLWGVSDARTGEPMGMFYLDMFPREGKYNHFAEFPIQQGELRPDGIYQRPVVCLICNFPPPSKDTPSLMDLHEVTTIFHEFGHGMHAILTRAKRSRFSGTSVPRDFVEAPSQMLENWTYDKAVLDTFAADYRDPSKKIPAETLERLKVVRLATQGVFYRRQLSFAMFDLKIHGPRAAGAKVDTQAESNAVLSDVFFPVPEGSDFLAYFNHLATGYDSGYYGYSWADSIAADMDTVFLNSPGGHLDKTAGMRMRDEIYSQGDSRDIGESIEAFLGRPRSMKPFLTRLGITPQ
ncbi:MAG TPA: M3 family metallopeptidase, partial [Opitutaceae bacterium]|nr:M3 family metallopeptidase [Opitutaceae bacterium]